jgi:hypothetical protein
MALGVLRAVDVRKPATKRRRMKRPERPARRTHRRNTPLSSMLRDTRDTANAPCVTLWRCPSNRDAHHPADTRGKCSCRRAAERVWSARSWRGVWASVVAGSSSAVSIAGGCCPKPVTSRGDDRTMADEEWLKRHIPTQPRQPTPGERVWSLHRDERRVDRGPRFQGESYGWECQCLFDGELVYGQRVRAAGACPFGKRTRGRGHANISTPTSCPQAAMS